MRLVEAMEKLYAAEAEAMPDFQVWKWFPAAVPEHFPCIAHAFDLTAETWGANNLARKSYTIRVQILAGRINAEPELLSTAAAGYVDAYSDMLRANQSLGGQATITNFRGGDPTLAALGDPAQWVGLSLEFDLQLLDDSVTHGPGE